jgi:hypothetical protein
MRGGGEEDEYPFTLRLAYIHVELNLRLGTFTKHPARFHFSSGVREKGFFFSIQSTSEYGQSDAGREVLS